MRTGLSILLSIMIVMLAVCGRRAHSSLNPAGKTLSHLIFSLIPAIAGNVIIIAAENRSLAGMGMYIYFIGMDLIAASILLYSLDYCDIRRVRRWLYPAFSLLIVDIVQLLLNPMTGHAFDMARIRVDGAPYYTVVPHIGQIYHRMVVYGFLISCIVIFIIKTVKAPRIYIERYMVILFSMLFTTMWESFYIVSGTPLDTSMLGFGIFGFLVYYFSLYFKPRRLVERMLSSIATNLHEALFFFDAGDNCIWLNDHARDFLALNGILMDEDEMERGIHPELAKLFPELDSESSEWSSQKIIGKAGKEARYYYLSKHIADDRFGRQAGSFLSIRDNTQEQTAFKKEQYNATHDRLTGLFNREYLNRRIHELVTSRRDKLFCVIYVDTSDFKMINDIYGTEFGDYAIRRIADWIRKNAGEDTVYGRLGGDTFGICQPADAFDPAGITDALSNFIIKRGTISHTVLMHVGVYEVTDPDLEVRVMFDRARMALKTIKNEYNHYIAYYDDKLRETVLWNQRISGELHDAIRTNQIVPFLQPLVDTDGRIVGAEALARWVHPEKGLLPPISFIPVFEQNGMIADVDRHIWRCACEILARWKEIHPDMFISVNVSPKDFYFMDVAEELVGLVREHDIDPSRLRIEITETMMMNDVENRINTLNDLKAEGFLIEMDDFGSGYSSLNMLKDIPVDVIKIDMMFLRNSENNARTRTILHNIINMTEDLGLESLTEGVETDAQYRTLTEMGCKLFQGYYFSKPVDVEQFEKSFNEERA